MPRTAATYRKLAVVKTVYFQKVERKGVRDISKNPKISANMTVADLVFSGLGVSWKTVGWANHHGGI